MTWRLICGEDMNSSCSWSQEHERCPSAPLLCRAKHRDQLVVSISGSYHRVTSVLKDQHGKMEIFYVSQTQRTSGHQWCELQQRAAPHYQHKQTDCRLQGWRSALRFPVLYSPDDYKPRRTDYTLSPEAGAETAVIHFRVRLCVYILTCWVNQCYEDESCVWVIISLPAPPCQLTTLRQCLSLRTTDSLSLQTSTFWSDVNTGSRRSKPSH